MNITKENKDALNAILMVRVEKEDYEERVEKVLRDYRKKARLDGFRPGMVPMGLIRKMYRKPVLVDEINQIVSEAINNYLVEENIHILGEPLPSEDQQMQPDWDHQDQFEFSFDLGLAPEFELNISPKDKVPFYEIKIDKKMTDQYLEDITRRFGQFVPEESVSEDSMLKVSLQQADEQGSPEENGISASDVSVSVKMLKDKETASRLQGKKKGDTLLIDIHRAFENETDISSMLNIGKNDVKNLQPHFLLTVNEINKFEPAPVNQELFDKVYGENVVSSEEEFREKLEEEISKRLEQESKHRFQIDARDVMVEKAGIDLPSDFLKRWLLAINKDKFSPEEIDRDFGRFENDLKWQLIRNRIVKDQDIHVTDDEILEVAMQYTRSQFQQYGLGYLPDNEIEKYARDIMKKEDDRKKFMDRKLDDKVFAYLLETVKLDRKKVSSEEFNQLFEENKD